MGWIGPLLRAAESLVRHLTQQLSRTLAEAQSAICEPRTLRPRHGDCEMAIPKGFDLAIFLTEIDKRSDLRGARVIYYDGAVMSVLREGPRAMRRGSSRGGHP